eukprot:3392348-Lingulodinium_polyedra.AAC.1
MRCELAEATLAEPAMAAPPQHAAAHGQGGADASLEAIATGAQALLQSLENGGWASAVELPQAALGAMRALHVALAAAGPPAPE